MVKNKWTDGHGVIQVCLGVASLQQRRTNAWESLLTAYLCASTGLLSTHSQFSLSALKGVQHC